MKLMWILALAVLLIMAGCSSNHADHFAGPVSKDASQPQPIRPPSSAAKLQADADRGDITAKTVSTADKDVPSIETQSMDRKIIRNAELSIQLDDPESAQRKIESIAESLGGFVVGTELKQASLENASNPDINVTATIRVPSAQFNAALAAIRALPGRILTEKTTGQDVTEEYVDLEARIRAKRALEAQFMEIMKQAKKVSDALQVQSQLGDVRTEIERIEGRRRYLEKQSSLSTITVTLERQAPVVTATQAGFGDAFKEAFGDMINYSAAIMMAIIRMIGVLVPIAIFIVLPIFLVLRFLLRKRQPAVKPPQQEAA